jgi:hypothetical protein
LSAIREALEPLGEAHAAVVADYSDQELELINDFLSRMAEAERARAEAVRETPGGIGEEGVHRAALGAIRQARLLVRSGGWDLSVTGGAEPTDLFRARVQGRQPTVRVRDSTVVIAYRSGMREIFDWHKRGAVVSLNPTIPWTVEMHGGMSKARADLTSVQLRSFELTGGAERIRLELGRPDGIVPVKVTGGASDVRIERPEDAAIRLRLKGGAIRVELDEQRLGAASDVTLESPEASREADRFEVEISGGTNRVLVTRRAA